LEVELIDKWSAPLGYFIGWQGPFIKRATKKEWKESFYKYW
jgi:hypothetical protein